MGSSQDIERLVKPTDAKTKNALSSPGLSLKLHVVVIRIATAKIVITISEYPITTTTGPWLSGPMDSSGGKIVQFDILNAFCLETLKAQRAHKLYRT
jgi:hypothetical protein